MKIKNGDEYYECRDNDSFTGIIEWCDGNLQNHHGSITRELIYLTNGEYHREDGPTVILTNGTKSWCLRDCYYLSEQEWKKEVEKLQKNRIISK